MRSIAIIDVNISTTDDRTLTLTRYTSAPLNAANAGMEMKS